MVDLFGTPYTVKLHVVERYRLLDYEAVKGDPERGAKENWRPGGPVNPDYLQGQVPAGPLHDRGSMLLHDALDCDHNLFARSPGMAGNRLCRKPARIPSRQRCGRPTCGQAGFLSVE
jgi:hypothetical protein